MAEQHGHLVRPSVHQQLNLGPQTLSAVRCHARDAGNVILFNKPATMADLDKLKTKIGKSDTRNRVAWVAFAYPYVTALVCCAAFAISFFQLRVADLRVPIDNPINDYLVGSVVVKNTLETGSFWESPRLGAPFGFSFYDFPIAESCHLLFINFIGLFTKDFILVANLYYLLGYLLASLTALILFRQMRLPTFPAIGMSLLFAFLPTHYMRGEYHLFLSSYYSVPLAVLLMLWLNNKEPLISRSKDMRLGVILTNKGILSIIICIILGSSGVYYAYFSAFFLVIVAISLWIENRSLRSAIPTILSISVISVSLAASLAPAMIYHLKHGANRLVAARSPSEADTHGLRITQLLLPVPGNHIPQLETLRSTVAYTLPGAEGTLMASLGIIGSIGFVTLICIALWRSLCRTRAELDILSTLNLAALLLAGVGGFGSVFAWTISSSIRGYSRISVFIAIFAFSAVLIIVQQFQIGRLRSTRAVRSYYVVICAVILLGLWDLTPVRTPQTDLIRASVEMDRKFFETMEASLPKRALVMQLPYQVFPEGTCNC